MKSKRLTLSAYVYTLGLIEKMKEVCHQDMLSRNCTSVFRTFATHMTCEIDSEEWKTEKIYWVMLALRERWISHFWMGSLWGNTQRWAGKAQFKGQRPKLGEGRMWLRWSHLDYSSILGREWINIKTECFSFLYYQ